MLVQCFTVYKVVPHVLFHLMITIRLWQSIIYCDTCIKVYIYVYIYNVCIYICYIYVHIYIKYVYYYYDTHFIDEETKAKEGEMTYPMSYAVQLENARTST